MNHPHRHFVCDPVTQENSWHIGDHHAKRGAGVISRPYGAI
jgi:hypothetical protein